MARSPPGIRTASRDPTRRECARLPTSTSPPRKVSVMALHPHQVHAVALERVLRCQVLGVEVVRHDRRLDGEEPLEVLDSLLDGQQRLSVLEVPDVV